MTTSRSARPSTHIRSCQYLRSVRSPGSAPTGSDDVADAALKREVQAIALLLLAVFLAGALMLHGWSEMRGVPA